MKAVGAALSSWIAAALVIGCGGGEPAVPPSEPPGLPASEPALPALGPSPEAELGPVRAAPADLPGSAPHLDLIAQAIGELGLEALSANGALVWRLSLHVTEGPRTLPPPAGHFWLAPDDVVRVPLRDVASWRRVEATPLPPPREPGEDATEAELVPGGHHAFRRTPSLVAPRHVADGRVRMTADAPGEVWLAMNLLVRVVEPGAPTLHLLRAGTQDAVQTPVLRPGEHVLLDVESLSHAPDDPMPALDGL